ncbi:YadA-like family protein [Veillonella sp. 20925_1_51]
MNSTATGTGSNVDNDGAQAPNSIAIGPSSTVTKQNSIAFGNNAQSLSDDSITIGRNAKAEAGPAFTTTSRAIAIGANSKVATNVTQGIAIGSGSLTDEGAVVTGDQSIAIGGNVKVDGHAAVAIGGDDARKAAGQQVSYTNTNDNEVTGTLQTAILNLTGYNLSNYKGTAASHAGVAYGTSALAGNAGVAIGTASDSMTRMNDKGQVVNNKPVTNAVAIGTGARANFDNSVAIGGGSNTDRYATKQVNAIIDGVEVKWSGGENISPGDVVSFGAKGFERQLKNVAPGEVSQTSTDAINGSQIYSLARKVTNIMNGGAGSLVNVNASGEPLTKVVTGTGTNKQEKYYRTVDVKDDGTLVTGAIAQTPKSLALVNVDEPNVNQQTQTPRTLGNVANGVNDNDAVNVSQLKAATVKYFSVNSTDAGNRDNTGATGTNAIAIGPAATATKAQSIALGNSATAGGTDSIAIGNGSVAADKVAPVAIGQGAQANGDFSVALGGGNWQFKGAQANGVGTTALGTYSKTAADTSYQTVVGFGANTTKANATAIGYNSAVSTEGGVALGANSSSSTGRTVGYNPNDGRTNTYSALTGNVIRSTTGAVAVGNGTEVTRQITGVAAGTNDTDAVNVAQLKSVNLAFVGDSGFGDVNLANNDTTKRFAVKGDSTYLTTRANGNLITVSANKKDISVTNGTATAATGMADAKNVAEAINKAVSQNAYTWNLTADNDTAGSRSTINKEGTVKFSGDKNITVARNGNTITSSLNKSIIVDSVKANNSVTTGSGSNQITLDGTTGAVTGNTFSGQSFTAGDNVLSNTTLQIGSPTNGNNVTITKDGLTSKAGTKTAKFGANGIDAGGQQITNVSSGGNVGTNAANITDVKNAVSDVTLKLDTNSKTGTVKLSESPLKVIGANGIRTDLVGTNNGSLVVGLDSNTVNATTKGIGLTGDTGSTGLKYLKDGDASFKVAGDGKLVTTKASATGVQVAVDTAKVKDLAVEAVTVSKANTSDNPITVTPTAGTNSKDYAIGIDTTKLASKTDLTYRANNDADANAQKVSLAKGLNFVNGDNTVATVAADGKVSYDLNAATKTKVDESATAVARNISLGADSGTASSQSLKDGDVAFNVKGATGDYISTNMNGNTVEVSTKRATINSDANTGAASVTGNDGLATAKNVADAINKAADAAKAGAAWNLTTNSSTTDKTSVQGGDTVDLINGDNIVITQDGTDKKKITVATKKDLTVDSVTAGNTVINTSGLTNGTTAITGSGITTDKVTVGGISIDKTDGINAGGKAISNVASGGTTDTNAANIGDVKQAVANLSQNLNITDGTNNGTVDLKNQKLNVAGANGVTATVNNQTITVGLDADTVNATTKGIGLTADTGTTGNKYLKDGDVSFAVTGDGNLVSTSATAAGVKVAVDAAKVKDLAVDAVTVSKDAQADNPITVTPTAGTNSKDYAIGIDTTKLAAKTDLTYRANNDTDANAKKVSLAKGLNFVNGTLTTASIDNDGVVKYDVNTAAITAGTDGTVTGPTTDGVATAQNVADAINAAKKASKTEITANTDEAANATTGNVILTSTTAADGHTIYDVKLNNKVTLGTGANAVTIDGTAGKATVGTAVVDGVNNTITTGGASPVTLDGATGTITGKTANIGGVTVNGTTNDITGLSNTTVTGADFATKGRAATEEQLKAVTSATALKFTGDVATNTGSINLKDDTFGIKGDGKYITTDVNGKDVNLTVSEAEIKKSAVAAVTVSTDTTDTNNPISVTPTTSADGTTKDYKVTIDGTKIANKTNLSYKANDGTAKQVSLADGLNFKNGTLTTASIDDAGVVKYDVNTAAITAGTDGTVTGPTTDGVATAQNVADAINAAKKAAKTEITANTGEAANATTGNVTLTSTTAADGHTIYDVKLNDKVTLGTGANAVTIDGTAGKITAKNAAIGGVTVDGDNSHVTGLSNTTWNGTATTGRAATEDQLKAVADTAKATTDAVNLKFSGDTNTSAGVVNLKDDTFNIVGDGKYVTTDANGKDLTVKVSEAEVKKSAVAAVTVSTDTTDANNPISVTPTTSADGTTKDYKVTIDGTKIANKTNLSYKANDGTAKQVSLADGLNFKNGTLTTASIDDAGVVKYDVNTATITAGTDGTVTGPTTDGVATAQNVADAINAAKKASKTEITANTGEAANATTGNVTLTSTTAADGHTIYDVKLNDKVTLGTGANAVTIDGTAGKATVGTAVVDGVNNTITTGGANAVSLDGAAGKATIGSSVVDGVNNTITTGGANAVSLDGAAGTVTGLTNKDWTPGVTKAVTGRAATEDQLQKVADAASSQTWNITADKAGTTGTQTGTKKNATVGKDQTVELVAGDNLTINQDERKFTYSLNKDLAGLTSVSVGDGTTETIKLDGATGKVTVKNAVIGGVTVDGDNSHVTGLSNTTWNGTATTGRAATEDQLKAVSDTAKATTDAVNLKFSGDTNTSAGVVNLKDDTFNIVGDGKYVTTDANGKDLTVKVSEAEVKKSAVSAVTVSTDTTDANNPISVTPTTSADGTTKDYKVTIDGTKIANKTNLSYKANDGTAKQVSLADGLNFKNGTLTTASIDDAGVVKYDVNTATITAGTDGTVTGPTTDGVATAQNVADAINAAKKAAKTEITANTGEAANATTGNVTLTSTTATDGHTIYDVKLNDTVTLGTGSNAVTIDGTAGKATIGSSVVDGVNNTITTGGANAVALDGVAGTVKTGTVTVTGGTTNDITGLSNTTVTSADFATKGRAATEEQLKAVGEQTWQITADKDATTSGNQTGTKKDAKVGKDDKVQLIAGENLTVNQNERDFTYSLNKDLVKMNSATFEATGGKTTVITGDSIAQTDGTKTNTSTAAGNTVADGGKSTATTADGMTVTNGADSTATTAAGTTVTNANGNTKYAADGVRINTTGKNPVSLTDAGLDNGNNVIKNVASGHVNNDDTDNTNAANIADVKKATTTVTANNGEAANATTGNVTLTSTTAADGHTIYDVKLNDTVTLGTGANAVTIDGTAGKATIGSSVVDGVNNTITTGGANAVALDGVAGTVKTGTVTVTGGTTNDITGLANTTVNSADFATKGRAATEEQLKAVGEQTWQITADKDATTSGNQTGTKKDAKVGKDDKVQLIAGENLTVNQNERDFTYSLNKDLVKMNSATFEATGGKTTVITGDSIAQTDGTKTNKSTAAGNTVADGGKSTATTADGTTVTNGADSTATTAAGTTVTNANGNTNYAADGVRINTTGKDPVSLTDAGLDNGNNVIKNVASGHVNNDDTDNTNAANIADVKKATTTVTANNGEAANATTGNVTLTSTTATDGHTIYDVKLNDTVTLGTGSNAVTIDGTAGKATIGSSVVDGVNNTITTGGANAVALDGVAGTVKTGTVTVTGGTTNDITGLSNTTVNSADFATKGRAATEEQLKAVGEQTWQITADKDATTSGNQTGTKKDAKVGKDDKVQLIAGENLTVNQNERDFTYSLNKDLVKMNSATFEATGGKTTVITGDSIAQTDGAKTNKSTAAGNTVADGGKSTATTADGTTVTNGADSTATTAAGTTVTNANGNTNYAADGVRINTTGKNPVSLTDAGLDNGNNVIKNVASGHVNNDDTDNTNAANIADVKKATTTVTANNGEAANATTGNVTLTSTTAADGHTIYDVKLNDKVTLGTGNNAVTIDGTAGKATVGTAVVDGVNNTITTGGANAVTMDGAAGTVKTGTVTVTGGTTNDITGLSNTTVNSADFATKGRAATEEQLKQVGEQTWQITADKDATTSGNQTGTKKDAKVGKDDKVQLIAGENLTVNQNERDFTYSLNKDLVKMNSATFEATGGKTTVITGDSIAQTDGTKTNRSTAAGNTVADGTKSTETTAAGQVIKDGAKTNTSTVDENTLVDGAKSNKTTVDSNVIDDGNGNVNTSNATSNTITDGTNTTEATASTVTVKDNAGNSTVITKDTITTGTGANKVTVDGTAGKVTAGSAVIDGVNNTITTGGANTVKLDGAAGTVTGLTNTAWTPGVTKAVSGRAATEDQLQQVSDAVGAGWNINSGTVAGSTGEANGSAKTKISSGEEVQLQAGNNLIIDQNGKTLAYSLNKNLKDMESAIFNATGGKTTVIKGDSIVQTDGGKTNTSNAAGNTVVDGTKSTATTAAGSTITDGAKTNTNTADKNVIDDGAGNTNTSNATSNTIADPNGNTNTATATSNTLADNAGNSNVSNATSNNLTDNAGNSNVSNATSNTLKNAAGDETKVDAKGATVKDAAGNTTNVASTGATVTNAAGDTTKVEATGTTVADAAGNKATFTKDGVTITKPGKDTVSLTGNGLDNGNNKIVNVADGTNDTDAVNVRQLDAKTKAATTELTANGGESANNTTGNIVLTKTTAPDGHIIYDNKLNDKITLGAADPTKAITVDGTNGTIKAGKDGNAVAINGTDGTIKAGDGTNAVAIDGVNGSVKVADKIALNGKDGKAAIGTVGIDGKDGIITTGGNNPVAVNGKDGVVTGLTNKTWDPNNITSGRAATEDQVQSAVANAGWDATVGTEGSGVNSTPSATPEKIRPNETLTFKAGNNMMVSHAGKTISYAVNPELTDMKSATFKDAAGNTTVTNGNGITITPGSANPNNPNAGPVSLTKDGLNNGNNQIKGVAPGSDDTDAVNIGQLKASNAKMGDAIGQVAGEVQRVGAHAAAMAALKPIQYDPLEPTQIMAGVGNYRGETAAALGLAHYTNEDTMFNVGVSVGGNHNMVNAGVTHKFGSSPEKKNIPDRYKAGPISSVYVMQDEVSSLKKENAEQKYVIADQAARLNTLEAENERQRQELAETKQGLDDLRAAVDKLLASKG